MFFIILIGTKLITFPIQDNDGEPGATKKEWIMNPNGKSYVCILHEYVQHALKKQPTYKFNELENAAMPYAAIVSINEMQYGVGYGTSKKQAKSEAAKATLEILIPEMRFKILTDAKTGGASTSKSQDQDLSVSSKNFSKCSGINCFFIYFYNSFLTKSGLKIRV